MESEADQKLWDIMKTKYRFFALFILIMTFFVDMTSSQGVALAMIGGMVKRNCLDPDDPGEFCWSENTKAVLLGAYFYGYAFQAVSTTIAKKFGINWAIRIIAVISAVIQLTFPFTVKYSATLAVALQTVRGFGASVILSSMMEFARTWCIGNEGRTFISFVGITMLLGQPVGQLIAGLLASKVNWRAYFYLNGCAFLLMCCLLVIFVPTKPCDSWAMSYEEKDLFMEKEKAQSLLDTRKESKINLALLKNIASRFYVWAFCIFAFLDVFQLFTILISTPFYLSEVLGASVTDVSYIQLGGGLGCSISTGFFMMLLPLVDRNVTWLRRCVAFLILPQIVRIIGFFVLPHITNLPGAVATIALIWASWGTAFSGSIVTINYEMDPENSSIILGLFNGCGTLGGFISPWVRAWMTSVDQSLEEYPILYQKRWTSFLYLNAGNSFVIMFVVFLTVAVRRSEWIKHPNMATEQDAKTAKQLELDVIENPALEKTEA